jgi:Flp pilus assembly protein TadB
MVGKVGRGLIVIGVLVIVVVILMVMMVMVLMSVVLIPHDVFCTGRKGHKKKKKQTKK